MAEKEYIEREAFRREIDEHRPGRSYEDAWALTILDSIPAADVRPVVTCERCVYHVDCGYHYCNKWCVNCPDDADFFCSYGEEES